MTKSKAFEWKDEYSVEVEEIDNQHKQLVAIIGNLFEALTSGKVKQELGEIFDSLLDYAKLHFDTEEKYFKEFNYESAEDHIAEHNKFKEKMLDLRSKFQNDEITISYDLIDYLEDWLIDHLMGMDRGYIECFKKNGLK